MYTHVLLVFIFGDVLYYFFIIYLLSYHAIIWLLLCKKEKVCVVNSFDH
jgi:hypothetical protein